MGDMVMRVDGDSFDIQAAKKRCEVATGGGWFWNSYDAIWVGKGDDSERIASVSHLEYDREGDEVFSHGDEIFGPRAVEARANAEFIAHARADLPAALEIVETLRDKAKKVLAAGPSKDDEWWIEVILGQSQ